VVLWAVQNGYFDAVPVERTKEFQNKLSEYMSLRKADLLAEIAREKTLSETLVAELRTATESFKQTWK
jgi:F-type H+-transporting ATPase subunit alpha